MSYCHSKQIFALPLVGDDLLSREQVCTGVQIHRKYVFLHIEQVYKYIALTNKYKFINS